MKNKLVDKIDEDGVRKLLDKMKDLKLAEHYDFEVAGETSINDGQQVAKFLESNRPLKFYFNESNILYYETPGMEDAKIFDVDVDKSFVKSDQWLYDKLILVSSVFPNAASAKLSNEMTSFYCCLVIASVFGEVFEEELIEISDNYSFTTWQPFVDEDMGMQDLLTSWVQIGSKYVKMVAAASKYAILREKQKKRVPSALQLPEETVLELNKTINEVSAIRFEYDAIRLSPIARDKLSKLECKVVVAERDKKIQERIERDPKIYQIWRLLNLNSNVIPPNILLKINREAKKHALEFYQEFKNTTAVPSSRDEKLEVKQVEDKLKREVRRAYLNKLFAEESAKFVVSPDTYVAPNFV